MICHHGNIGTPFFQTYQYSHPDGVNSGLTHTVESVYTPFKIRFHASGVIYIISGFVVCFLETDYSVQPVFCQFGILFGFKRHNLYFHVAEVLLAYIKCLGQIRNTSLCRVFAGYQKQVFKRCQFLDGYTFVFYLLRSKDGTLHVV